MGYLVSGPERVKSMGYLVSGPERVVSGVAPPGAGLMEEELPSSDDSLVTVVLKVSSSQ